MDSAGGSELSYNMPVRSMLHGGVLSPEWDSSLTLSKAKQISRKSGQENVRLKSGKCAALVVIHKRPTQVWAHKCFIITES